MLCFYCYRSSLFNCTGLNLAVAVDRNPKSVWHCWHSGAFTVPFVGRAKRPLNVQAMCHSRLGLSFTDAFRAPCLVGLRCADHTTNWFFCGPARSYACIRRIRDELAASLIAIIMISCRFPSLLRTYFHVLLIHILSTADLSTRFNVFLNISIYDWY